MSNPKNTYRLQVENAADAANRTRRLSWSPRRDKSPAGRSPSPNPLTAAANPEHPPAEEAMTEHTFRLVFFGSGRVGKTSIISQFLHKKFPDQYVETVEDQHCRDYKVGSRRYKLNLLDTAGDLCFPAMRRLSIASANGFVLVYSVTDPKSVQELKNLVFEIREVRGAFGDVPTVIVGNKCDIIAQREIDREDIEDFLNEEHLSCGLVEASAKTGAQILEIFNSLLQQQKSNICQDLHPLLTRRMSEQTKHSTHNNTLTPEPQKSQPRSVSLYRKNSHRRKMKQAEDLDDATECCIM